MTSSARTASRVGLSLLACLLLSVPSSSQAAPGYVNFMFGQKLFDADDWDPIDKQPTFGVEGVFGPATWPVHIDTYLFRASKEKTATAANGFPYQTEATTFEVGAGVNKTWMAGHFYPYLNAGAAYAKVDVTFKQSGTSTSDDGNGFGGFAGAGAFYRVGTRFNVGGAVRYSTATVDFNAFDTGNVSFGGANINAGGLTLGVLLGWGWPATPTTPK